MGRSMIYHCELCGRKLRFPKRRAKHNFCSDCAQYRKKEIRVIYRKDQPGVS
jgi:ribosome-binding protein aMBF1 (putative translation factor)